MPPPLSAPAAKCMCCAPGAHQGAAVRGGGPHVVLIWSRAHPSDCSLFSFYNPCPLSPIPVPHHAHKPQSNGQEGDRLAPCPHVPVPFLPPAASDAAVQPQEASLFAPCSEAHGGPVLNLCAPPELYDHTHKNTHPADPCTITTVLTTPSFPLPFTQFRCQELAVLQVFC